MTDERPTHHEHGNRYATSPEDIESAGRTERALNRLAKWRSVFAGWQLGTRPKNDGATAAVRDHREVTILMRAELNALLQLLLAKGLIEEAEFTIALGIEAELLADEYAKKFPGMTATDDGISMDPTQALTTMSELGFPK